MKAKKQKNIGVPGIKKFKLDQLNAAEYNPRIISDDALDGLTKSIEKFGFVEPIVVNIRCNRNVIVGGHQRFKVLQSLGYTECICVTVSFSKKDEMLLNLTLNNKEIQGKFIKQIDEYIEKLRSEIPESDIINLRISQLQAELGRGHEKQGKVPDDDIPKPAKKTITRPGDLWILGKHRLLCGDSTNADDVARLMGKQKASLLATDPPYCIDYTGMDRPNGGKDWTGEFKEKEITDAKQFWIDFYKAGFKYIKKNTALYLWHSSNRRRDIEDICKALKVLIHQTIVWVKPSAVMSYSIYMWQHEPCFLMWREKQKPSYKSYRLDNKQIGTVWPVGFQRSGDPTTPEYYTDVWELDYDGKKRPSGIEHPTVKPVECFAIPMRVHTNEGDICYEPFSGSGTQIIAAEKLNRRCFAIEKEPFFVDVAVKRWEAWTGKKAKLSPRSTRRVTKKK